MFSPGALMILVREGFLTPAVFPYTFLQSYSLRIDKYIYLSFVF